MRVGNEKSTAGALGAFISNPSFDVCISPTECCGVGLFVTSAICHRLLFAKRETSSFALWSFGYKQPASRLLLHSPVSFSLDFALVAAGPARA